MRGTLLEESPPPSPILSDVEAEVISFPSSSSDLAGLSDVSLPSDEEDKPPLGTPDLSDNDPDSGFQDITQSMLASTVDRDSEVVGIESEDEDQTRKTVTSSLRTTPSASMALINGDNTVTPRAGSRILNDDLVFPSPFSDGRGPFGLGSSSLFSLDDGSTLASSSVGSQSSSSKSRAHLGEPFVNDDSGERSQRRLHRIRGLRQSVTKKVAAKKGMHSGSSGNESADHRDSSSTKSIYKHRATSTTDLARSGNQLTPKYGYRWPTISAFGAVGFFFALAVTTYNASVLTHSDLVMASHGGQQSSNDMPYAEPTSVFPTGPADNQCLSASSSCPAMQSSSDTVPVPVNRETSFGDMEEDRAVASGAMPPFKEKSLSRLLPTVADLVPHASLFKPAALRKRARKRQKKARDAVDLFARRAISYSTLTFAGKEKDQNSPISRRRRLLPIIEDARFGGFLEAPDEAKSVIGPVVEAPDVAPDINEDGDDLFLLPLSGVDYSIKILPDFDAFKRWIQQIFDAYLHQIVSIGEAKRTQISNALTKLELPLWPDEIASFVQREVAKAMAEMKMKQDRSIEVMASRLAKQQKALRSLLRQSAVQQERASKKIRRNAQRLYRSIRRLT